MPKKHSGSKKSKSQKQSKMQQWEARFRTFVNRAGNFFVHRGPNRYDKRKHYATERQLFHGAQHAADKGRHKLALKTKNRRLRRNARTLHQAQRRAS